MVRNFACDLNVGMSFLLSPWQPESNRHNDGVSTPLLLNEWKIYLAARRGCTVAARERPAGVLKRVLLLSRRRETKERTCLMSPLSTLVLTDRESSIFVCEGELRKKWKAGTDGSQSASQRRICLS